VAEDLQLEQQICQFHVRRWVGLAIHELKESLPQCCIRILLSYNNLIRSITQNIKKPNIRRQKMDELVKLVVQKTGISDDQARQAINVVVNYLKDKLPAPIAAQVDGVLNNQGGGVAGALGGLFGKK